MNSPLELHIDLERPTALLHDLCAINPFAITAPSCHSRDGERVAAIGGGPYRLDRFGAGTWRLTRAGSSDEGLARVLDLVPFSRPEPAEFLAAFRDGRIDGFADGAFEVVSRDAIEFLGSMPEVAVREAPGGTLVDLSIRTSAIAAEPEVAAIVARLVDAADPIDHARILKEALSAIDSRQVFVPRVAPRRIAVACDATLRIGFENDPLLDRPARAVTFLHDL